MPLFGDLRWVWLPIVLPVAIAACSPEDVSLDPPPGRAPPPQKGATGACTSIPLALAALPGALARGGLWIDETNLYALATAGDGSPAQSIWRIPKDGSLPQRLVTSETPIAQFTLSAEDSLFWTTAGSLDGGATGAVWSYGSTVTDEPTALASGLRAPGALVVAVPNLFWAEQDVDPSGRLVETVVEMSIDGGLITPLQTLDANDVPHGLLVLDIPSPTIGVADTVSLFWTTADPALGNQSTAEISECPLTEPAAPLTRIAGPDAGGAGAIAEDNSDTGMLFGSASGIDYLTESTDGQLSAPRTVTTTGGLVDQICSYGFDVYFVDPATESLMVASRVPDAGPPRTLAIFIDPASPIEVDTACVYWLDARAGAIEMVKK